jgi:hypothetical protein
VPETASCIVDRLPSTPWTAVPTADRVVALGSDLAESTLLCRVWTADSTVLLLDLTQLGGQRVQTVLAYLHVLEVVDR